MIWLKKGLCNKALSRNARNLILGPAILAWLGLLALPCVRPAVAQSQPPPNTDGVRGTPSGSPGASTGAPQPDPRLPGNITGTVDRTGAVVAGCRVRLTRPNQSSSLEALSGDNGQFSFANVPPGSFQLSITAPGFAPQAASGILRPGETYIVPPVRLTVATALTEVQVGLSTVEVSQEQVREEEK